MFVMQDYYGNPIAKCDILTAPNHYPWNLVLYNYQFTQDELIKLRTYVDLPNMIKYQKCLTRGFLREHFKDDINACLEVDWDDVEKYVRES